MSTKAAVFVLAACGSAGHAPATVAPPAGPLPVVSVAVWPERWPTIAALPQARAMGVELPTSFWTVAQSAASEVGLKSLALPPPGIDTTAPITAELEAPGGTFEAIALAAAKHDMKALRESFGLRVRVTIPARDVGALATALESASAAREQHARPALRVVRGAHAVALDISFDDKTIPDAGAPPVIAVAFDAGHDSAARAALRLHGLADLGATTGMLRMMGALAMADRESVKAMFAEGLAEVLTGYLMIDPATSVTDALLLDVPAAGNPQAAFEVVDAGKAALSAGGLAPGKRTPLDAVKWSALLEATPQPALFAGASSSDIAMLFHECGSWCFAYVAMGNGLGLARVLGGGDVAALLKKMSGQFGLPLADVAWADNLVFLLPAGARQPAWKVPAASATQSEAEKCYRRALLSVRAALKAGDLAAADTALADQTACVRRDPAVFKRHQDLRELVLTLRGS